MGLQNEIKNYLSKYGISQSHMARLLNISNQQLSAWFNEKLVLPDYHIRNINEYLWTLKKVDNFLQENNLVL